MKLIRICGLWRGYAVAVMALAGVWWLLPGKAAAQQQPAEKSRPVPAKEMESFQLKHVPARNLLAMIQEIWGQQLRVSADDRTNTLVVLAAPEEMVLVKRFISAMDVDRGKSEQAVQSEQAVRVFPLKYTRADSSVDQAIRVIFAGRRGNVAVDHQRNLVIVSGDKKTLEAAEKLLRRLDTPPDKPKTSEMQVMQVRVVWLASGLTRKEASKPPVYPEDMKEVVAELAKMGVEDPRLVTQTVVTALPDTEFRVDGVAGLDPPYQLSVSGRVLGRPGETNSLKISINATRATVTPPTAADRVGRLETEITAPPGHSVVLGMTPTATSTSVFVVQILPKK